MQVEIRDASFNPLEALSAYQEVQVDLRGKVGATACFIGTMRDFNQGDCIERMHLEHYPGMTEKHLQRILEEAGEQWTLLDALVIHRVGVVYPHDPIVLVAVWSAHRGAAFDACRFIMEALKSRAPFWKNEILASGERWVANNTPG